MAQGRKRAELMGMEADYRWEERNNMKHFDMMLEDMMIKFFDMWLDQSEHGWEHGRWPTDYFRYMWT